jgi:hypothetical protein
MEHLNNLPRFYKGQKVAYITGIVMPKGTVKIVKHVHVDPCGCQSVYFSDEEAMPIIGYDGDDQEYQYLKCEACGDTYSPVPHLIDNVGWDVDSFRPLLESPFPSLTMSRVIEKEKELISMN